MSEKIPKSSIASVGAYMQSLQLSDRAEKGILVRVGTVIDGIINAQRGHSNAGARLDPRKTENSLKKPPKVVGSSENIFNGAAITIDAIKSSSNLSNYEVQIADNVGFADATTKVTFNKSMIFKGLAAGTTYYIRVRGLTKTGEVGSWTRLANVVTTPSAELVSADVTGQLAADAAQVQSRLMVTNFATEDFWIGANFGLIDIDDGGGSGGEGGAPDAINLLNWIYVYAGINWVYTPGAEANKQIAARQYYGANFTTETRNLNDNGAHAMRTAHYPSIAFFDLFNPVTTDTSVRYGEDLTTDGQAGWKPDPSMSHPFDIYFRIDVNNSYSKYILVQPVTYVLF
jgi:hypothetical protein